MGKKQKAENFVRLAECRMSKTFEELRKISNLGNSYIYEYTEEQVQAMVAALSARVALVNLVFENKPFVGLGPEGFTFEDYVPEPEVKPELDDDNGIVYETTEHTDKTG